MEKEGGGGQERENIRTQGNTLEKNILFLSFAWHQTSSVIWD